MDIGTLPPSADRLFSVNSSSDTIEIGNGMTASRDRDMARLPLGIETWPDWLVSKLSVDRHRDPRDLVDHPQVAVVISLTCRTAQRGLTCMSGTPVTDNAINPPCASL